MSDAENETGNPPENDPMGPPPTPCECYCLHCGRVFMSDGMWFQKVINAKDGFEGFWMCPTPNCDGAGFFFDIYPTDPANNPEGCESFDDDEDEEELEFDENGDVIEPTGEEKEYDPAEPKYAEIDAQVSNEDDPDIEGEEWKHGLAPGEQLPEPESVAQARRRYEEEERKYDSPDERPRVLDWSDRDDDRSGTTINDDDIPF